MNIKVTKQIAAVVLFSVLTGCLEIQSGLVKMNEPLTVSDAVSGQVCDFNMTENLELSSEEDNVKNQKNETITIMSIIFSDISSGKSCSLSYKQSIFIDKAAKAVDGIVLMTAEEIGQSFSMKFIIDPVYESVISEENQIEKRIYNVEIIGLDKNNAPIFNLVTKIIHRRYFGQIPNFGQ